MNDIDWIKSLDRAGAGKNPPQVDIADAVLREIRNRQRDDESNALPWAALFAALVGGGVAALALQTWLTFADPLTNFADSFKLVLQ